MPIDPSIALGVRPLEVPNPMNQLAQVSQIQAAQRQGEVAQMQLEQLKQEREDMLAFQKKLQENGQNPDLRSFAAMLIKSPKHVEKGIELLQKLDEQDKYAAYLKKIGAAGAPAAPAAAAAPAVSGALGSGTFGITPAPMNALAPSAAPAAAPAAPVNQLADLEARYRTVAAINTPGAKAEAELLKTQIAEALKPPVYHNVPGVGLVDPRTRQTLVPSVESTPTEIKEYERAKKEGFVGSFFDYKRKLAEATRAPATPATPAAPVAVVGEDGKVRYVSREEAIGKGMTPASAFEGITPKEIQKREAALPAATSAVKGFETKSDSFLKDLKALRDHPGLSEITGFVAGRMPGLTADGRAAQALYDKVVAKGGFQALQDLRDASKTGGALGNVSNQEGKQLTASFAAIDRRQDAKDVQAALDTAIADVQGARTRMREAYDDTYRYKSERGGAAPAKAAPDPLGIR